MDAKDKILAELKGKKVLVVDDMLTMRKIVKRACKQFGFEDVIEAADGIKAWETLNEHASEVGLIVSDWNMPNCTGIDFLRRVRASEKFRDLYFVLLTAESEIDQVKEALDAGVDNYIVKPFQQSLFEEKISKVRNRREYHAKQSA